MLDQLTKLFFSTNLKLGQSIPLIPGIFHFTYTQNSGAAFSLLRGQNGYLVIVAMVVILAVLLAHYFSSKKNWPVDLALGLILGGSAGNLLDRLWHGAVVDFLDFRIWPVFNIADSMINIGVLLLIISLWRREVG